MHNYRDGPRAIRQVNELPGRIGESDMRSFVIRPTLRVVQQIAGIERRAGRWESLLESLSFAARVLETRALFEEAESELRLDSTSPSQLIARIAVERDQKGGLIRSKRPFPPRPVTVEKKPIAEPLPEIERIAAALSRRVPISLMGLDCLYRAISADDDGPAKTALAEEPNSILPYRSEAVSFTAALGDDSTEEKVFTPIPAFLIRQRLAELLDWLKQELDTGTYHPLLLIGTYHLLFLQIHPYPRANHRLALMSLWQLLSNNGSEFVRWSGISPIFWTRAKQYFAALRQAEKTAWTDWSSQNVWLEFFLNCVFEAAERVMIESEQRLKSLRLTRTQEQILAVIRNHGAASRSMIIEETGVNPSTIKYNLSVLAARGHVKREGGGRSTGYRIASQPLFAE